MTSYESKKPSKIIGIQFSILSPHEIQKASVAEITNRDTYVNNKPVLGGLFDPRMGILEPGFICPTDGLDYIQTPGYFGHMNLARPVFYIQYLATIMKILRCVCIKCSKILIDKDKYNYLLTTNNDERWQKVFAFASKKKRCGEDSQNGCGCLQPKLKKEGLATLIAEWNEKEESTENTTLNADNKLIMKLVPELVIKILRKISDEDVNFMGFSPIWSRPEWMICQTMAVPPPAVRPSVKHDAQQRSEDDLTHILINIIKANKTLQEKIEANSNANIIDDWTTVLQYYVATLVDNKIPGVAAVAQRSGRPLKAIKDRLNGKGGRVRGNLMGKRVDFSARSVITPDPNLSISELGVPLKIAKNLTKPITVNSKNKNYLMKFILNGPDEYPGAKIYEKKNGDCISLRFIDRESIVLEDGDIVHRHILDGDAVLFNRQPTLHRMSMMCHLAKIMFKGDTFRMNVGDTKPYNADFDGDEMNLHMPQDEESEAELRHLAAVQYQIISPANNKSIVGIFQDSLLGSYLFTRNDVVFDSRQAMNLLMHFSKIDLTAINFKKPGLNSFELLSQIMPNITMKYKTKKFDDAEDYATSNNVLEINKGNIVRGQFEKGILGDTTRGLLQRIYNDYSSSCSRDFVDDLQNIVTEYMKSYSYSVGISDLIADSDTNNKIVEVINQKKLDVKSLIDETHLGIFENKTGKPNVEEFETQVNNILNKASFEAGKIGRKNLDANNRFVIMVNAGSKGSDLNISQMISCLGQQNVDGKRIPYGFEDRTLPHFTKFNDSPEARGFVESSFIGGLRPEELFFHAMGGRVGLIDTAVKSVTWETPIIIIENNEPKYVKIGEFVDTKMKNNDFVEKHDERNLELLNTNNIFIPTTNEDGIVSWEEVTALTRHDPGEKLYQIKTLGGRDVIVTENKSLLIWQEKDKKLKEMYSPDIKIGDCVPVTQDLCDPPIIKEYIELEKYLIKEKYIYGSDFNKAIDLMNNEMISKKKIPDNWWENNNKINFTLPYTKKSSLQRTNVRSNTNNIKNNCVYPYSGIRNNTEISDKFILNKQNGIFIGLFLAEGNIHNSHITITNNNEFIRNFVKSWFDSYNINYNEKIKINKLNGTTTTITGNSCIMSEFITKLLGSGAKNKYVPDEAFIAPKEFVIGLLNGYFSGDGYVSNNSIEASSASKRLIEGINMLCSRLGIFGKVFTTIMKKNNINTENILPAHRISIRAQWAKLFAENVDLIDNDKSRKLYNAKFTSNHRNFKTFNNVVLDKITEINIIGVENHPKMYDLTIPTTLNFGLANGLQVRDTSQTGYIQRRIIKSLEDLMVNYDMTVRNNKGKIIQYTYGDDGFDPVFVESQQIPFINMNVEEIYGHYQMPNDSTSDSIYTTLYTKQTLTRFKKQKPELKTKTQFYIDYLIDHRKKIVENVLKFIYKGSVNLPVSFVNIINNIAGNQEENVIVDITPMEVFNLIEANFDNLNLIHYCKPTELFKVLYYYYLSPKELLMHKKLTKKSIELLLININNSYKKAIVAPGEMVGMIAAQSIGEPTTQLTLNSVTYDTPIIVRNKEGFIKKVSIGEFTDFHIKNTKKLEYYENKDTTYSELNEFYEIPSATEDGKITWNTIEAVTQHPVVNEDGTNTLLKVTTEHGREVIATKAKSFLQLIDGKIDDAAGKDLKVGDYLPVSRMPIEFTETRSLNLKDLFSPKEYVYGSEIAKVKEVMHEYHWWLKHNNNTFIVPYKRSDTLVEKLSSKCRKNCNSTWEYKDGIIYPFPHRGIVKCTIPEIIDLDYDFGYLLGAYAAEGCITKTQISIANNDNNYFEPIQRLAEKYNITTKIYKHENKGKEGWTSQDIRLYSVMLTRIIETLCGRYSHGKFIHSKIVYSNKDCLKGFLDAYIGGDGSIHKIQKCINIVSVSKDLIWDVHQILNIFDIYSSVYSMKKCSTDKVFPNYITPAENIKQPFQINITNNQAKKLANLLNIKIKHKQEALQLIINYNFKYEYNKNNLSVPNIIDGNCVMEPRDNRFENIYFDKIKSIEEVPNPTKYVYDLTVETTRNFNTYNGLCLKDTFHFAGVASKSNVTRGVPRIEEILSLSETPKNPSCTIYLNELEKYDQNKVKEHINELEYTHLRDLVNSIEICFDPSDTSSLLDGNNNIIEEYNEFEKMLDECSKSDEDSKEKSKWILRLNMNKNQMLDKSMTMEDIHFALNSSFDNLSCMYTDYNSDELIFRIRISKQIQAAKKKKSKLADSLDQSDEIYILKNLQNTLLDTLILRGIKRIQKVLLRKITDNLEEVDMKYVKKEEWVLDTVGTNLLDLLALDFVDSTRTITNSIIEIYNVLGVEAARQSIFDEFSEVIEFDSTYINYHHLTMLCDRMCCNDKMVSVFRHGINNDNIGPIAKASFEETPEMFLKAARHGELDMMRGVSANVMCGQQGYFGTNAFKLLTDMDFMMTLNENSISEDKQYDDSKNFKDVKVMDNYISKELNKTYADNIECNISSLEINYSLNNIKETKLGIDDDYDLDF